MDQNKWLKHIEASGGHIQLDRLVPGAFNVLPSGIKAFNNASTITHTPPETYELYDRFGAR